MGDTKERYAKRYKANFIEPGVISYEDQDMGVVLVTREAIEKMRPTFIGKPIPSSAKGHRDLTPEEAFRKNEAQVEIPEGVGVVTNVYHADDGWDWVDFVVWDEETIKDLDENGFSVSCAYMPTETKSGGVYHNIEYDEEVVDGYYTHLAIVPNPRYEESKVYENEKKGENVKMGNFFNFFTKKPVDKKPEKKTVKNEAPPEEKKEDPPKKNQLPGDSVIEIDGQQVSLEELITVWEAEQQEKKYMEESQQRLNEDDEIETKSGERKTIKELVDCYRRNKKENESETDTMDENQNSDSTEDGTPPVVKENQKTNEKQKGKEGFNKIKKAYNGSSNNEPSYESRDDRFRNGKLRYGSLENQEGGKK